MIAKRSESMGRIQEVRKRDNRIVPFDESKIADAIYRALRSVETGDRALAAELAAAVRHFLEEKLPGSIPGIEDIQDLVETVLIEMGHTRVAKAYILYRQKRTMLRETLEVRKVSADAAAPASEEDEAAPEPAVPEAAASAGARSGQPPLPEVDQDHGGVSRWSKSKIAAALIREADIAPGIAAEIASAVEHKVLASGISRISTALIRELVDNELFERGYSAKLEKQAPLGLPKYNIEQVIFGTDSKEGYTFPKTPSEVRNIIASRILHQYSLREVFTPAVAHAHRDGRIFIHRLSDPARLSQLRWSLPAPSAARVGDRLVFGTETGGPESYLDTGDFFRRLANLAHFFSEEIRLAGLGNMLKDPAARSLSAHDKVLAILERLAQMDERPRIALEMDLTPDALPWLEGILDHSRLHPRRLLAILRLRRETFDRGDGASLLEALAALYERGERLEFLPEPGGDGGRHPGLVAGIAKVTINLPRVAFRSARDKRSSVAGELEEVLQLAVRGHLERRRFIERLAANREAPLWEMLGGGGGFRADRGAGSREGGSSPLISLAESGFSVGLLGLNEFVKFLTGKELHQDEVARRMGLDVVEEIDRILRREARSLGIQLVLEETKNVGPLHALETADAARYPQMAEIDRGRSPQWTPRYTDGVRLHRMAPLDPLRRVEELAPYLRHLAPAGGIVEDFPEMRTSAKELLLSLLEECLPAFEGQVPRRRRAVL